MGLTVRNVKTARYQGGQDIRWDDQVPGLGLRVNPGGTKSYVLKYRTNGGRSRLHKLGRADVLTLAQARDRAKRAHIDILDGKDPQVERQHDRASITVEDFVDEYIKRHSKPNKRSWKEDQRRLKRVKAKLGKVALQDLTSADVSSLHSSIGKTAPVEANRIVQLLAAALNKAAEWGRIPKETINPADADSVKRYSERSRERFLTREELPRVLGALGDVENIYVRSVFMLILFAGLRKSEALRLEWSHVDLENGLIRIPETKNGGGRSIPLTDAAVRLLEELPREKGNPYTFAGHHRGKHVSRSTVNRTWRTVREAAGVEDVTIHDLRRTCGSWLAMQGVGLPIIGAILGHSSPQATAIYARLQPDAGREALGRYTEMLSTVEQGGE